MTRRLSLPRGPVLDTPPTLDELRARLGGRGTSPRAGELVWLASAGGGQRVGVLLWADDDACDVLFERGLVKRSRTSGVLPHLGSATPELESVAASLRAFARLGEGQRVIVEDHEAGPREGVLREKCRWGALVMLDAGPLVAVGFRRVVPSPHGDTN